MTHVPPPSGPEKKKPAIKSLEAKYAVLVFCATEADQKRIFQQMRDAGHRCRALTSPGA